MLKSEVLHSFILVAELGGISRAAELKHLSAMAMSKQMSNLEKTLGQSLFTRSGRQLKLTEFGQAFKQEAEKVLVAHKEMDSWLAQTSGEVEGKVRVVAQSSEFMNDTVIPWVAEFCNLYPSIELALDVKESLINIAEDDYDIFWGVGDYLGAHFPNLKRKPLWHSTLGIYASPDYLEQYGVPNTPDDLSDHFVIGYLHNQPSNVLVLHDGDVLYKMLKQRVATVSGQIDLACNGLGILNADKDHRNIISAVKSGKLIPILVDYWWKEAQVFTYFHNVKHEQPKVRAFLNFFYAKREDWL